MVTLTSSQSTIFGWAY